MSEVPCTNDRHKACSEEISPTTPPEKSDPTREEREGLIRALRVEALQRADPLAANLQMMCADLIDHATQVNQALATESPDGAVTSSGFRAYEKKIELMLKLTRQIDRIANLQRQESAAEAGR